MSSAMETYDTYYMTDKSTSTTGSNSNGNSTFYSHNNNNNNNTTPTNQQLSMNAMNNTTNAEMKQRTVIRIKRKRHQDPLDSLVVSKAKRVHLDNVTDMMKSVALREGKTADKKQQNLATVFRRVETVRQPGSVDHSNLMVRLSKLKRSNVKQQSNDSMHETTQAKSRQSQRERLSKMRFSVISRRRQQITQTLQSSSQLDIVDVEQLDMTSENSSKFAPRTFADIPSNTTASVERTITTTTTTTTTATAKSRPSDSPKVTDVHKQLIEQYLEEKRKAKMASEGTEDMAVETDDDIVYDLYVEEETKVLSPAELIAFELPQRMNFEEFEDQLSDYDSEDSNCEGYYANDYPDETSDENYNNDSDDDVFYRRGFEKEAAGSDSDDAYRFVDDGLIFIPPTYSREEVYSDDDDEKDTTAMQDL